MDIFLSILVPFLFVLLFAIIILPSVLGGRSNRDEIKRLTAKIQRDEKAFRDEFVRIAEEEFGVTCEVEERINVDRFGDIEAHITVYGLDDREEEFRALMKEFQYLRTVGAMVDQTSWHPLCHFRVTVDGAEEQTT